jgi:hypothetical protein
MAASPGLKVYAASGEYIAACKHATDAAAVVAARGVGATIRDGHKLVVWQEGSEAQPASESFDFVAGLVDGRIRIRLEEHVRAGRLPRSVLER